MSSQDNAVNDNSDIKKDGFFRRLWEGWKRIARKIGDFNARVILTLFYFLLLCPFALILKIFTDPLELKQKEHIGWHERQEDLDITPLERATKQS